MEESRIHREIQDLRRANETRSVLAMDQLRRRLAVVPGRLTVLSGYSAKLI